MIADDGVTELETKMRNLGCLAEDATIKPPKIVLVGGDKVGKSALIESLVQRGIFCKEERETRRPVIIKMKQSNERPPVTEELTFIDMPSICKLLQTKTNEFVKCGDYHKNVDSLCDWERFLEDENNLILAVFAANDIDGFESTLGLVREFDPEGIRTIGVVTMLDVTPANKELTDILTNCKNPLKRGYYGVINRNEENTNNNCDIQVTRHCAQRFFDGHPIYGIPQLRNRMGADNLASHLMHLIFECRKVLLCKIESEIEDEPSACASISDLLSSANDTVKGICDSCCLPFIDESTKSKASAMTSAIVSSCEPEPQFDNDAGLTIEIVLEGLESVNPPTIDGDMVAVEGPNYKIAISSPGATRRVAVVEPASCYFTADDVGCVEDLPAPPHPVLKLTADQGLNEAVTSKMNTYNDDTQCQSLANKLSTGQLIGPSECVKKELKVSFILPADSVAIDNTDEENFHQMQLGNESADVVVLNEEDLIEQMQADCKQNEDVDPCNQCGELPVCDLLQNPEAAPAAICVEKELNADVVCHHKEPHSRLQTSEESSCCVTDCDVESISDTDISLDCCGRSMTIVNPDSLRLTQDYEESELVNVSSDMYQLPNSFEDRKFVEECSPCIKCPDTDGPPVTEPNAEPCIKLDIVQKFWAYADDNKDCQNPDENTDCGNRDCDSCRANVGSMTGTCEFGVDSPSMSPSSSSSSLSSYSSACSTILE